MSGGPPGDADATGDSTLDVATTGSADDARTPPAAPEPAAVDAVAAVAKPFRLQFEEAQDAWVLLYPEGMVKLNRSAGETLARCDGARRVGDVVALLEEAFGQRGLEEDVRGFLGVARAQGWVTLS